MRQEWEACLQSMLALGDALQATLDEHGKQADLQRLKAANEELYETRRALSWHHQGVQAASPELLGSCSSVQQPAPAVLYMRAHSLQRRALWLCQRPCPGCMMSACHDVLVKPKTHVIWCIS